MQEQLQDVTARSAAAHREYEASLQELQHSVQSAWAQAATADEQQRETAQRMQQEIQGLQVLHCCSYDSQDFE